MIVQEAFLSYFSTSCYTHPVAAVVFNGLFIFFSKDLYFTACSFHILFFSKFCLSSYHEQMVIMFLRHSSLNFHSTIFWTLFAIHLMVSAEIKTASLSWLKNFIPDFFHHIKVIRFVCMFTLSTIYIFWINATKPKVRDNTIYYTFKLLLFIQWLDRQVRIFHYRNTIYYSKGLLIWS